MITFVVFTLLLTFSDESLAWGGRGHHTICDAATYLVKEKELREFLTTKPQVMGHLCNIPDIYWKSLGGDVNKVGSPAHYVDIEILGLKVQDVPTDYKKLIKKYEGQKNAAKEGATIFSIPTEFGSIWWRADQFFRRAVAASDGWKKAALPTNFKEEQDENLPFNKAAYEFIVNIGLMGHFVGDASQPFHSTFDHDGWYAGHGGIHSYYEDFGVAAQGPDLMLKIVEGGKKLQELADSKNKEERTKVKFLTEKTVIEKMKALSTVANSEIQAIYAVDPVKTPSSLKKEKGMEIKTPAEREPAEKVAAKFEPLIVAQMSRSAALLAKLWDEAYEKAGKPKITAYRSFKYPFTPEFVVPDYYDVPKTEMK
jgi:hypothetical protein